MVINKQKLFSDLIRKASDEAAKDEKVITYQLLSEKIGIPYYTFNRIRKGDTLITLKYLDIFCTYLEKEPKNYIL
jgi:DNA-binding Xre family transcriptional regulator